MAENSNKQGKVIFEKVHKTAQTKDKIIPILKDCSFKLEPAKLTALLGPSGSGKTTIINLIAGYASPDSGTVTMDENPVTEPSWERLVLFQETALFPWLTCYENVMFGPTIRKFISREQSHRETLKLLEKVGLKGFENKYPIQLSGGMQRRAELARVLINRPKVMLMDEPFRGLDAMTRKIMQDYYLKLFEENRITNLFTTSELEEAIYLADTLIIITNRPAKVKKVIEVNLPRPRKEHVLVSEEFRQIKQETLELLHEEVVKASRKSRKVDIAAL